MTSDPVAEKRWSCVCKGGGGGGGGARRGVFCFIQPKDREEAAL